MTARLVEGMMERLSKEEAALRTHIIESMQDDVAHPAIEVTRDKLIIIASDVIELVLDKNADYGDAWQRCGLTGIAVKMTDKWCRVATLADGREALVTDEHVAQTLIDAIGYAFLGLLYIKETRDDDVD